MLRTTLLSLSNIMLLLCLHLRITVTSDTSNSSANGTRDTISDSRAQVGKLSFGFLALAFSVLAGTCLLERLFEEYVNLDSFICRKSELEKGN